MHRALGYAAPLLRAFIALILFFPDFVKRTFTVGRATVSIRAVVVALYLLEAGVQVILKAWSDRSIFADIRKKQLNSHLKVMISYLDGKLDSKYRGNLRANLFEHVNGQLRTCAHHGHYSPEEISACWEVGQGACGVSFRKREDIFCDLKAVYTAKGYPDLLNDMGDTEYHLTPDLYGRTRNVLWVMCFFLTDEDGHAWGVLCFDSISCTISKRARNEISRLAGIYRESLRICYCT